MGNREEVIERAEKHLRQLAPHQRDREAAKLIADLLGALFAPNAEATALASSQKDVAALREDARRYRQHRRTSYLFELEHGSEVSEERFNEKFDADIDRGDEI